MSLPLSGCSILVLEDEYFIADDLADALDEAGAEVIGPVGAIGEAVHRATTAPRIDCAILDINVRGEMSFPVARVLRRRRVPFVFASGYGQSVLTTEFADVPLCQKPLQVDALIRSLATLMQDY